MVSLTIIAPEVGDAPYAASARYNSLIKSFEKLSNKNISILLLSGVGHFETKSQNIKTKCAQINTREGKYFFRIFKEFFYALFCILYIPKKQNTLVLISIPNYISALVIAKYCQLTSKRYFLDVRDLYPEAYELANILNIDNPFYNLMKKLTKNIYIKSEKIFVATHGLGNIVRGYLDQEKEIHVILNGFPREMCESVIAKNISRTKDVIFHGTLGFMQDIKLIEELIKALPNISFSLVGDGASFEYLKNKNLKNLFIYNRMPLIEVLELVASHRLGLSIRSGSWYDKVSLPVKVFEYIGLNLNVISFPETEFNKFESKISTIFEINSRDVLTLSKKINEVIKLENLGESPPKELSREYNSEKFMNILLKN